MKLRYPAEAFALGIILFSAGMKEAFAAGILVILTAVFAEFLKDLLENAVPKWSLTLFVLIASGVFCDSEFPPHARSVLPILVFHCLSAHG